MIHCHNLSHEDNDMMLQYQVGKHSIDCDSINTDPPRPLPAPDLVPQQPAATAPVAPPSTDSSVTTDSTSGPLPMPSASDPTTSISDGGA